MWTMKGVSRRYLLTRTSSELGWEGQFSCSMEGKVLPNLPCSKRSSRFCKSPRHLIAVLNHGSQTSAAGISNSMNELENENN